jgi:heptosyltransferase III
VEILVLHPGGLGDIILSLAAISLLRRQCPAARITIAANLDHLAPLAEGCADAVISLSSVPLHPLYTPAASFEPDRRFWDAFDRIVSWTGFGNSDFMRNLKMIKPDAIVSSWRPEPAEQRHVSRLFIDSLGPGSAGVSPAELAEMGSTIFLNAKVRQDGSRWLRSHGYKNGETLIAVHPGAGSESKRWPLQRFIEIARRLTLQKNIRLLFVMGPAEQGLPISKALMGMGAIVAETVALDLLAAILVHCRAFVGNDSGISHLAAGLKVPSIVLFGPTLPQHWAPLGKHVAVLRQTGGCDGCSSGCGDHTCLLNISVEDVIQSIISVADSR